MAWKNFSIWRGRLPHWRADDVSYYATFRHRRRLEPFEALILLDAFVRNHGRRLHLRIVCVLPEATELIFDAATGIDGEPIELSDVIEKSKARAGKQIVKESGERFPPFYNESYDRIIRDESEWLEHFERIFNSPVKSELAETPADYEALWIDSRLDQDETNAT